MGMQLASSGQNVKPVNGKIYRTSNDQSMLVLGVKSGKVFVEFADGSFRSMSEREWQQLHPNPSRC